MTTFQRYARAGLTLAYLTAVVALCAWVSTLLADSSVPGILLANTFATPSMVLRKVARRLVNTCGISRHCSSAPAPRWDSQASTPWR